MLSISFLRATKQQSLQRWTEKKTEEEKKKEEESRLFRGGQRKVHYLFDSLRRLSQHDRPTRRPSPVVVSP